VTAQLSRIVLHDASSEAMTPLESLVCGLEQLDAFLSVRPSEADAFELPAGLDGWLLDTDRPTVASALLALRRAITSAYGALARFNEVKDWVWRGADEPAPARLPLAVPLRALAAAAGELGASIGAWYGELLAEAEQIDRAEAALLAGAAEVDGLRQIVTGTSGPA
jgi:hypothetical protein